MSWFKTSPGVAGEVTVEERYPVITARRTASPPEQFVNDWLASLLAIDVSQGDRRSPADQGRGSSKAVSGGSATQQTHRHYGGCQGRSVLDIIDLASAKASRIPESGCCECWQAVG